MKKIVLSFFSQHGRRVGERKGYLKKSFSNKKHETERRTALTHYLDQITESLRVSTVSKFCLDIVRL